MSASEQQGTRPRNVGGGRRLLVLHEQNEPIAQSIFVLSAVYGFAATCMLCSHVLQGLDECGPGGPQLVLLDTECRIGQKARALKLIRAHSPQCRVAVLSDDTASTSWAHADLVIARPVSAAQVLERLCELVEPPVVSLR
ncbi:hypothetical protein LJ656_22980 [Paraburkholderia sp. MMS20-SJTR3]|uniref:Response regulatory domain-containing protein n=1 Tax=Paraburkholderia sejongensis TaxID=2886946 RepID=A0ABS8JZY0_9BURK|nr:hypothetical protein [Paraburkholderia sp. MMS20-SJTR3]MCC8395455.1 hypothetical protein [Paraburkholderia sp. MMS20-SJTR3]